MVHHLIVGNRVPKCRSSQCDKEQQYRNRDLRIATPDRKALFGESNLRKIYPKRFFKNFLYITEPSLEQPHKFSSTINFV